MSDERRERKRALFDAHRALHDYAPERQAENWLALEERLRAGDEPHFDDTAPVGDNASSRRAVPLVSALGLVAAAALVWVWWGTRPEAASVDAQPRSQASYEAREGDAGVLHERRPSASRVAPASSALPTAPGEPEADGEAQARSELAPSSVQRKSAREKPARKERRPRAASPQPSRATPTPPSIARELELLQKAQLALGSAAPHDALEHLRVHAREFPTGALAPEREGLWAVASCQLERPDGPRMVEAFVRAYPGSSLVPRVREACEKNRAPSQKQGARDN